jgi:uncharacterized lipoprotein YddW (UPF0748 family)
VNRKTIFGVVCLLAAMVVGVVNVATAQEAKKPATARVDATKIKDIKAYCIDFNWGGRRRLSKPGQFGNTDPAAHLAWYKMLGVNVIQTFCVSTNGYAWYKNGFVPAQPGLKHDFLPEMVKLGHAEGMLVMGYFTIACNPRWGAEHPDLSYPLKPNEGAYHIPYTDEYLDFLSKSISDAVRKTGIDGIMLDWVWQPKRTTHYPGQVRTVKHKWLASEKQLYKQLTGEEFPGEGKLTKKQDLAYSRKAIDRCWKAIRKAAKDANPKCIIWLTSNHMNHPHVVNSDMYKETDWLMNEKGDIKSINQVKATVGKHTRLITCLARWNGRDATKVVPEALKARIGLYGFSTPARKSDSHLAKLLARPVSELKGDDRNVAGLARAYNGVAMDTVRNDKGQFIKIPKDSVTPKGKE